MGANHAEIITHLELRARVHNCRWFDTRNAAGTTTSYDIYAARSGDGGQHFSPSVRITPQSVHARNLAGSPRL
jgi:hypothetical protein